MTGRIMRGGRGGKTRADGIWCLGEEITVALGPLISLVFGIFRGKSMPMTL